MRLDEAMQTNRPFRVPGGEWLRTSGDWFIFADSPLEPVENDHVPFESEEWMVRWDD